jgi:hypothetical protein
LRGLSGSGGVGCRGVERILQPEWVQDDEQQDAGSQVQQGVEVLADIAVEEVDASPCDLYRARADVIPTPMRDQYSWPSKAHKTTGCDLATTSTTAITACRPAFRPIWMTV